MTEGKIVGIRVFALGNPLIVFGPIRLVGSYKLPIRETLMPVDLRHAKLNAPALSLGLDITLETSVESLELLANKG